MIPGVRPAIAPEKRHLASPILVVGGIQTTRPRTCRQDAPSGGTSRSPSPEEYTRDPRVPETAPLQGASRDRGIIPQDRNPISQNIEPPRSGRGASTPDHNAERSTAGSQSLPLFPGLSCWINTAFCQMAGILRGRAVQILNRAWR